MLIVPVYNTIVLPKVQYHLVPNLLNQAELEKIQKEDAVILLPLKKLEERAELKESDFYSIGVISEIKSIKKEEEGLILTVRAQERADILDLSITAEELTASYRLRPEVLDITSEEEAGILHEIKDAITETVSRFPWGVWITRASRKWNSIYEIISMISPYLEMEVAEKYELLEMDSCKERGVKIKEAIFKLKETLDLQASISKKMEQSQNNGYREAVIHKQMELLQKELDELNPDMISDEQAFLDKIKKSGMPEAVEKEVMRVFNRMKQEGKNGHEYASLYDYLDFVTNLSWKMPEHTDAASQAVDLKKAREILDKEHYGLKNIKERILQQLAVMSFRGQQPGSILLFVGAPGTGKTSMGKSIAEALGRTYVRISLGGIRDEAEIRGHRRTYVGAMPGRIMAGMKRAGVMNPVMVLDEIDKLAVSYNGDPASALLEVLDPEQNDTFADHYMNVPYDLSNVLFICTANSLDGIPGPLLDRMEVISLSGYTPVEKLSIAKEHLLKKSIQDAGLKKSNLSVPDNVVKKIIEDYTMEAGVRGLKKQLDKLCRQSAMKLIEENKKKITIREKDLEDLLGKKILAHDRLLKKSIPGVATGLAWTQAGGDILFIETAAMHGSGRIHLTGKLGDVMKESAEIAVSLVKSIFYNEKLDFKDKDIHIHVPSGAVPKDGPSAGITLFTALTSLVTGIPVDRELAMTGEISLRGQVLPIGGLPEKLMAAERAGIKKVLIPSGNEKDLKEIPDEIKEKLEIIPVDTADEVILHALQIKLPKSKKIMQLAIPRLAKSCK